MLLAGLQKRWGGIDMIPIFGILVNKTEKVLA